MKATWVLLGVAALVCGCSGSNPQPSPGGGQDGISLDTHVAADTTTASPDLGADDTKGGDTGAEIYDPGSTCVPDCCGKECGPDGCGGECGPCWGSDHCVEGVCQKCMSIECWSPGPCSEYKDWGFCTCEDDSECHSGVCADMMDGRVCVPACLEECPEGMTCAMTDPGPDVRFMCVPQYSTLCWPCGQDEDCGGEFGYHQGWGVHCQDFGDSGHFCTTNCQEDRDCFFGFRCLVDDAGDSTGYCVPTTPDGECPCTFRAVEKALATPCGQTNEHGTCPGERHCTTDGLTGCDAPVPSPEACNGLDDDCDGQVDEDWPAQHTGCDADGDGCADGLWICEQEPVQLRCSEPQEGLPELCDGLDNDCDGEIDEDWLELGLVQACDGPDPDSCAAGTLICAAGGQALDCVDDEPSQYCIGKECGDDGCGGTCGECQVQHECVDGLCVCVPECSSKICGSDGCGGSCGQCSSFDACSAGECVVTAEMVTIPAGAFWMGCNEELDDECSCTSWYINEECPFREVHLDAYEIDLTEATVAGYTACEEDNSCTWPSRDCQPGFDPALPIRCLTWAQARDYCQWAGKRLCTEAEWEKAARGIDSRIYPWGNEEATCEFAVMMEVEEQYGCGTGALWPPGSRPAGASPFGLLDMAGNIDEWVSDLYCETYYQLSPSANPPGPDAGWGHVIRGGSLYSGIQHNGSSLTGTLRSSARYSEYHLGTPWSAFWPRSAGVRCCR